MCKPVTYATSVATLGGHQPEGVDSEEQRNNPEPEVTKKESDGGTSAATLSNEDSTLCVYKQRPDHYSLHKAHASASAAMVTCHQEQCEK